MSHVGLTMRHDEDGGNRPPKQRKGVVAGLAAALVIVGIVGAAIWAGMAVWDRIAPTPPPADYPGPGSGSVVIQVERGDSVTDIGNSLRDAGVVASTGAFVAATTGDERANTITPGAYELLAEMSAVEAFERLLDPASRFENTLTLREGLRIDETVATTSEATGIPQQNLRRVLGSPQLELPDWAEGTGDLRAEGFLFPATYALEKNASARRVLQTFVDRFEVAADRVGIADAQSSVGVSPYEALIVASLVEAEGRPQDFDRVARVIYNRLDPATWAGTYGFLQLDATLNYALQEKIISLSELQLRADGPYNTYTRAGLPPTPINSPGEAAMAAALNPADGDWLYYVTVNPDTGETKFTNSYEEFLTFKAEFEQWLRDNG